MKQYFSPNLSVEELPKLVRTGTSDPLKSFGEACRLELKSMRAAVYPCTILRPAAEPEE